MTPEERQTRGAAINAPEEPRSPTRITARKSRAEGCGDRRAAEGRNGRCHAAGALLAGRARPHPSDQPDHRRDHRDLRRHGLLHRRRSGHRDRLLQFHRAEFPGRPSGARNARHLLLPAGREGRAQGAAHPHLAGAGPHHGSAEAADPHHHSRQDLSPGFRRHPFADVPSGRGPGHRQDSQRRQHALGAGGVLQGLLRGPTA